MGFFVRYMVLLSAYIDNTLKVVLDALNKAAYEDDKQVVEVSCRKWYSQSAGYLRISVREVKQ